MNPPLSDEERRERAAAGRKAWWDSHPDYYADEEHLEQRRAVNRESMRRRVAADRRRQAEVKRVGEWARKNPEKRKAARERFKDQNPEKYRASQREYYHRNKEAIKARTDLRHSRDPEKLRERRQRYRATARSKDTPGQWKPSEEQRARYAAQSRDTRRLDRQLKRAGLPPRQVQRATAAELRVNLAAADTFFNRKRSRAEVRRVTAGDVIEGPVTPAMAQAWTDYLTQVRARRAHVLAVRAYITKHGKQLREDVTLDSRARQLVGKPPLDVEAEIWRRAVDVVRSTRDTPLAELAERVHLFANLDHPLHGTDLAGPTSSVGKARGKSSAIIPRESGLGR